MTELYHQVTKSSLAVRIEMNDENTPFMRSIGGSWRKSHQCWFVPIREKENLIAFLKEKNLTSAPVEPPTLEPVPAESPPVEPPPAVEETISSHVESIDSMPVEVKQKRKYVRKTKNPDGTVQEPKPKRKYTKKVKPVENEQPILTKEDNEEEDLTGYEVLEFGEKKEIEITEEKEHNVEIVKKEEEEDEKEEEEKEEKEEEEKEEEEDLRAGVRELFNIKSYHPKKVVDPRKRTIQNMRRDFVNEYVNSSDEEEDDGEYAYKKCKNLFQYYRTFSEKQKDPANFHSVLERIRTKLKILQ